MYKPLTLTGQMMHILSQGRASYPATMAIKAIVFPSLKYLQMLIQNLKQLGVMPVLLSAVYYSIFKYLLPIKHCFQPISLQVSDSLVKS